MSDHVLEQPRAREEEVAHGSRWLKIAWRQYRLERRMFWRNPSAAFFNFLLPLLFLAMFGAIFAGQQADLDVIVPGIAGLAVMSTTFTAIATNLVFLRESGVLKRMRGTPMPSSAYLSAIAAHAITNTAIQVVLITTIGHVFMGVDWPGEWVALVVFVALGAATFAALGVALSHVIPNFDSAPAYTNAVFLPMIMICGVFYDAEDAPTFLKDIAQGLPLKHLIDGLSGAMVKSQGLADHGVALLVLGIWGGLAAILAVRGFSWESRRS